MRKSHLLRRLKTTPLPHEFVYFDCETLPEPVSLTETRLRFRLAVALHRVYRANGKQNTETWGQFTESADLWDWIDTRAHKKTALYVVAHNAEFDFRVSKGFTNLCRLGWTLKRFFIDANKFTIWWQKDGRSIIILDSLQLLPGSLAKLGEMIGAPKDTMPVYQESNATWFEYCRQDVVTLAKAMDIHRSFLKENDLGGMAKTTAGQAFRAFRYRYMREDIEIHGVEEALELERDGYFGGRTECFRIGPIENGDHYILDVHSMYPYVMKEGLYPVQLISFARNVPLRRLHELSERYHLIADVRLKTNEPAYPIRYNKRLVFPVGEFQTVLQGAELSHALKAHRILRCFRAGVYYKVPLFNNYVDDLYALRQRYERENNWPFTFLTKLLLNSLYGKFGQRGFEYEQVGECDPDESWSRETFIRGEPTPVIEFAFGGKVYIRKRTEEAYDSFPAIAGAVTAYARQQLWTYITDAGRPNVLYCDTDSLLVNQAGYDNIKQHVHQTELGKLKLERIAKRIVIYGLKDYAIEGIRKTKGVKLTAIKVGEHEWIEEKWERIHSALKRGNLEDYRIKLQPKRLKLPYDKGMVQASGTVHPYWFSSAWERTSS